MVTDKLKELVATRAKLMELESAVAADLRNELAGLPARYGFDTTDEFVAAVLAAAGKRRGRKPSSGKSAQPKATGKKKRSRAVITDETRGTVKKLVGEGKTGAEIAKSLGISLPSVQNIKKALGLVRKKAR